MTPHIESKKEDIAKTVIMPGDPLRAKRIAEKYLENPRLVNGVRNMLGYTGTYHGKEITVFASGMGIPSIGIYAYELFSFYDVERIIRIGSCGSSSESVRIGDIVMATSASSASNFAALLTGEERKTFPASKGLNELIQQTAEEQQKQLKVGPIITSDVFDVYTKNEHFLANFPPNDYLATEMEAYALFYLADLLKKEAACFLTVVDSKYQPGVIISSEDRQNNLDNMIELALLASLK